MTFHAALWVISLLIVGQFAVVCWAFFGGESNRFKLQVSSPQPYDPSHFPGAGFEAPLPKDQPTSPVVLPDSPNPENVLPAPGISLPEPKPSIAERPEEPYRVVPAKGRINDPAIIQVVRQGVLLRKKGDTQGALTTLKEAEVLLPNKPRILHEIAVTYSMMGLRNKAIPYWQRVYEMGESGAGDYFAEADMELNTSEIPGELIPDGENILRIGDVVAKRDSIAATGERVFLRIPIHSLPNRPIEPGKVRPKVDFYDLVDGSKIEPALTQSQILWDWTSEPIDWQDSMAENWDVTYVRNNPASTSGPLPSNRKYYGYIIRLYYDNGLQDVVANPRTLIDFRPEKMDDHNPRLDNSLFGGR